MKIIFFDDYNRNQLLPLTFTRPVAELRIGILSIREKWEKYTGVESSWLTESYLSEKFPYLPGNDNLFILGGLLPDSEISGKIANLKPGEEIHHNNRVIAFRTLQSGVGDIKAILDGSPGKIFKIDKANIVDHPWHIFSKNGDELEADFKLMTAGRKSAPLSASNKTIGDRIFLEEGAKAECSVFNTETGPVYLGSNTEVMEGSMVRGPFALCEGSSLKLGAKIYGPTTIGPHSRAGGEINNSVIQGYSNKGHDGFLGNSVLGEWCNIGADSNNSNLKNNYAEVRLWSYPEEKFISTGLQFCGLIMGDHSKCGINTMFNTGTVVGVNANIFGSGFPRNFVPSFSWGGAHGMKVYQLEKAFEVAGIVMQRRGVDFNLTERQILEKVFTLTEKYRK